MRTWFLGLELRDGIITYSHFARAHSAFNFPRDEWIMAIIGTKRVTVMDFFRDTLVELDEESRHTATEVLMKSLDLIWQLKKETAHSGLRFLSRNLYFGHDKLIRLFIDTIENDSEPPVPDEKGKLVLEITEQNINKR